ncbi:MAG: glutamine amidotransferase [Verrucomicrobiota bacterium]
MLIYEHTSPTFLIVVALVLAVLLGAYSFWRYAPKTKGTYCMAGLYLALLALIGWCLLMPGRKSTETHTLKPRFVVALDTSKSMGLHAEETPDDRWTRAMEALSLSWTKSISAECEIDVYAFNAKVSKKMPFKDAKVLRPDADATLLRDGLEKITGRYAGMNVAGGLILTDGLDTREAFDDWASEARPFPLYTLNLEPGAVWDVEPDLRVDTVRTPKRVTLDWKTELKAVVSGQGTGGKVVAVQLWKEGVMQQEIPTQIPEDGGSRPVTFELAHPEIGVFTYKIFVPPIEGETNVADNEFSVSVQVIDAKNRLLYVEGSPRWESKYLKRALQSNRQVTPLIFVAGPGGKARAFGPVGSMTPDMTETQLAYFKIVIIGNLDAEELSDRRANNLLKFVESGGSLVLLGGTKAWSGSGFAKTPLRKLLPVKSFNPKAIEGEFPVSLTTAGRSHPAFAGDPGLWDVIPPILSVFPDVVLSQAAQALVLAETPKGPQSAITSQRYGQGKVVAVFTDSLWKWKLHPNAIETRPYQRFWDQLISWLLPEEEDLDQDRLDIFADRETLILGEEVVISARLGGERDGRDIAVRTEMSLPDESKTSFSMRPEQVTTSGGKSYPGFTTTYKAVHPGLHRVSSTATIGGKEVESDQISFYVKSFSPESAPRPANAEVLKAIAKSSGGQYFEDLQSLNDELRSLTFKPVEEELSEYNSLWQDPRIIALMMVLAAAAWIIRKLNNMP